MRNNIITAAMTAMVRLSAGERRADSVLRSENSLGITTFSLAVQSRGAMAVGAVSDLIRGVDLIISKCALQAERETELV
jgi:hypothetical protein